MAGERRQRIAVIGSGTWGTTLAMVAESAGHRVSLYVRNEEEAATIRSSRVNARFLPNVELAPNIEITSDLQAASSDAALILLVVPSQTMRSNAAALSALVGDAIVVSATKGLDRDSLSRMTEVLHDELPQGTPICALSGPNLAVEVAHGKPATTVIASTNLEIAEQAQDLLSTPFFRAYTNEDVIGVEIAGALKNVIAIGAGIADGMEAGDNAKAAFLTRGIAEIARLGFALGAHPLTFAGLAGLGDLVATCASRLSRNHFVGQEIAKGRSLPDILSEMTQVAEGVFTTKAACELGKRHGVEMPISEEIEAILFEGKSPIAALASLMSRESKDELEELRGALPSIG